MNALPTHWIEVAVQTPAHSGMGDLLTYRSPQPLQAGQLVRVPLGRREVLGVVWSADVIAPNLDPQTVKDVAGVLEGLPPLDERWRQLMAFAAQYYQRSLGEMAVSGLPPQLRDLDNIQLARRLKKQVEVSALQVQAGPDLSPQQTHALQQMAIHPGPFLLFGNTGSGKTEVYLRAVQQVLQSEPQAQALILVPEINLTPQLEARVRERFGEQAVVSMHSGLTPAQRLKNWLAAHSGAARIVLGTRMAVLASIPHLRLIVVDEEHDPSYKQQEGARYSARDLAIYRGQQCGAQVLLGSATPSLESWHHSRPADEGGRYLRLHMPERIGAAALPVVRRVDMNHQPRRTVLSAPLVQAIQARVAKGEQSMLLLNRRGYAPVLYCADCGWKSECRHCSAFRVLSQRRPHPALPPLRCHRPRAARLPVLRQCRHRAAGPRHRATRRTPGRTAGRRTTPRWPAGAHCPHRR